MPMASALPTRATDEETRASAQPGVLQLRADRGLLQEIKALARRRHISANRFVMDAVRAALQAEREQEKEREWRAGFEEMGRDADTNNVEYALPAAREVLLGE